MPEEFLSLEMSPWLTVLSSPDGPKAPVRLERALTVVGRDSTTVNVTLPDPAISRRHLAIRLLSPTGFCLQDLSSANGLRVNGVPTRELSLQSDAVIRLGRSTLHVGYELSRRWTQAPTDRLIRHAATALADAEGIIALAAETGAGVRRFARQLHARRRTAGSLYIEPAAGFRATPVDTVLTWSAEVAATLHDRDRARVILAGRAPAEASLYLPPVACRRQEVWRVSQLSFDGRHLDADGVEWWLTRPLPEGWRSLNARLRALQRAFPPGISLTATDLKGILEEQRLGARNGRRMSRPARNALAETLQSSGVSGAARRFKTSRRQVYRWIRYYERGD